jgi:hypothetical protein
MATRYPGNKAKLSDPKVPPKKGQHHHRFFGESFHQKTGGYGHHSISDEESESQKSGSSQAHVKTADDVRHNGANNIGQQGDHEKSEEDQPDRITASRHELPFSLSELIAASPATPGIGWIGLANGRRSGR